MRKILNSAILFLLLIIVSHQLLIANKVDAATLKNAAIDTNVDNVIAASNTAEATISAEATDSSKLASPSAEVVEKIKEKKDQDITETGGKQKSKLETYLDENPTESLNWNNFIQHAIRKAVSNGLQVNVIVLIILFPLIASFIAALS